MIKLRVYAKEPYNIAVIHGGPGAPGGMETLAKELSQKYGVIEPFQSANSIDGQLEELKEILDNNANFPITLIGHSWGAWLSYIFAEKFPHLIKKLILVGSGAYEDEYVSSMNSRRLNRLTKEENLRSAELFKLLNEPSDCDRKDVLREFGELMSKADSYEPICIKGEAIDFQPKVFHNCMKEINELRRNKELLNIGKGIKCPVVAIHGEYDSHPFEGVEKPLAKVINDFKFILLKNCGHSPWNELYAKDKFYEILFQELV